MEWDYSGRKGRDGQKKKIGKANERKGKDDDDDDRLNYLDPSHRHYNLHSLQLHSSYLLSITKASSLQQICSKSFNMFNAVQFITLHVDAGYRCPQWCKVQVNSNVTTKRN